MADIKRALTEKLLSLLRKDKPAEEQENPDSTTSPETADEENKEQPKQAKSFILFLVIFFSVVAVACIVLGNVFHKEEIPTLDLGSCIIITNQKNRIDGSGEITADIDQEAILEYIKANRSQTSTIFDMRQAMKDVCENISVAFDPKSSGLSNDDEVVVTATLDAACAIKYPDLQFATGSVKYTMTGLPKADYVDPFATSEISLRIEGISGSAVSRLDIKRSAIYSPYINYDWTPKTGLSNGDIVTITISPDVQKLFDMGYAVPDEDNWSNQYTVSGLPVPTSSSTEIPASLINSMVAMAESGLNDDFQSITLDQYDVVSMEPDIVSIYFFDKVDKSSAYTNYFDKLEMINCVMVLGRYTVQDYDMVTTEDGRTTKVLANTYGGVSAWIFPNIVIRTDGSCDYSKTMVVKKVSSYQTEADFLNWAKKEYKNFAVEEIGKKLLVETQQEPPVASVQPEPEVSADPTLSPEEA